MSDLAASKIIRFVFNFNPGSAEESPPTTVFLRFDLIRGDLRPEKIDTNSFVVRAHDARKSGVQGDKRPTTSCAVPWPLSLAPWADRCPGPAPGASKGCEDDDLPLPQCQSMDLDADQQRGSSRVILHLAREKTSNNENLVRA
jgi:hypothetical protein